MAGLTHTTQAAPYPAALQELVDGLTYRPGWTFELHVIDRGQGSRGLTLTITVVTVNSHDHEQRIGVRHLMPVPPAAYNRPSWQRWLLDQVLLVERHEACEFFEVDGAKPYAPNHGPGWDPYIVTELTTDVDRRTASSGRVNP